MSKEQEAEGVRNYNDYNREPSTRDEGRYFSTIYSQLNEDHGAPEDETTVLWRVTPDYGEKDQNVVMREDDIANGKKKSNWVNPLSFHDDGSNDDQVVLQMQQKLNQINLDMYIQYDESEGPTKEDNGELDQAVIYREDDIKNGEKFSGWKNPLSMTDDGNDDDTILVQQHQRVKYDESEGPTKEDNGELD